MCVRVHKGQKGATQDTGITAILPDRSSVELLVHPVEKLVIHRYGFCLPSFMSLTSA